MQCPYKVRSPTLMTYTKMVNFTARCFKGGSGQELLLPWAVPVQDVSVDMGDDMT